MRIVIIKPSLNFISTFNFQLIIKSKYKGVGPNIIFVSFHTHFYPKLVQIIERIFWELGFPNFRPHK